MSPATATPHKAAAPRTLPRMLEHYRKEIAPALAKQFNHKNVMAIGHLEKIVLNIGCGEFARDAKILEAVQRDLGLICGQRPVVTRAKKAISNFKIRENDPVGCKVTLRRRIMYDFLEKLISIALPRIRDFRGLSPNGFDHGGNYSFGLQEHTIFPEIQIEKIHVPMGMDIAIVTTAKTREEAFALLKGFGFPFAKMSQPRTTE